MIIITREYLLKTGYHWMKISIVILITAKINQKTNFAAQFEPNVIPKAVLHAFHDSRTHMLIEIDIKSTQNRPKLKIWLKHDNAASDLHAWANCLMMWRGGDNALMLMQNKLLNWDTIPFWLHQQSSYRN